MDGSTQCIEVTQMALLLRDVRFNQPLRDLNQDVNNMELYFAYITNIADAEAEDFHIFI
jgi:hypothetical protein